MPDCEIKGTMTIQEASAGWSNPLRDHLKRWGETFAMRLIDLHIGHVKTYQTNRSQEVSASEVDAEVAALLELLNQLGLGGEIEQYYKPFQKLPELTSSEFNALPIRVRQYIRELKNELSELRSSNDSIENKLRKANWARRR